MARRRGKRNEGWLVVAVFAFVAASVVVVMSANGPAQISVSKIAGLSELSTAGFVEVEPNAQVVGDRGVISLSSECYRMVAGTDAMQAESIVAALEGTSESRPNAHELMRDAFDALGVDVLMTKITELRGQNFHGKLILRQGNTLLSLDAKPSDGIALAMRTNATIYFNETLLRQLGEKIC